MRQNTDSTVDGTELSDLDLAGVGVNAPAESGRKSSLSGLFARGAVLSVLSVLAMPFVVGGCGDKKAPVGESAHYNSYEFMQKVEAEQKAAQIEADAKREKQIQEALLARIKSQYDKTEHFPVIGKLSWEEIQKLLTPDVLAKMKSLKEPTILGVSKGFLLIGDGFPERGRSFGQAKERARKHGLSVVTAEDLYYIRIFEEANGRRWGFLPYDSRDKEFADRQVLRVSVRHFWDKAMGEIQRKELMAVLESQYKKLVVDKKHPNPNWSDVVKFLTPDIVKNISKFGKVEVLGVIDGQFVVAEGRDNLTNITYKKETLDKGPVEVEKEDILELTYPEAQEYARKSGGSLIAKKEYGILSGLVSDLDVPNGGNLHAYGVWLESGENPAKAKYASRFCYDSEGGCPEEFVLGLTDANSRKTDGMPMTARRVLRVPLNGK